MATTTPALPASESPANLIGLRPDEEYLATVHRLDADTAERLSYEIGLLPAMEARARLLEVCRLLLSLEINPAAAAYYATDLIDEWWGI